MTTTIFPAELLLATTAETIAKELEMCRRKPSHCQFGPWFYQEFTKEKRKLLVKNLVEWLHPMQLNLMVDGETETTKQALRMAFFWVCGEPFVDVVAQDGIKVKEMEAHGWEHLHASVFRKHFPIPWAALSMALV